MVVVRDLDPKVFLREAGPMLYEDEALNGFVIGMANNVANGPPLEKLDFKPIFLRVLNRDKKTAVAFVQTRRQNGVLSQGDSAAIGALVHYVQENNMPMEAVAGPQAAAMKFAREFCQTAKLEPKETMLTNLMKLEQVVWPQYALGEMMFVQPNQTDQAIEWQLAFQDESLQPFERMTVFEIRKNVEGRIANKTLFGWVTTNQGLVSLASLSRETRNSMSINFVYTPPELRGRGFASNLVGKLSQYILDKGKSFVCLNADKLNSQSNSIYQKLGYRNVGVFALVNFAPVR